jgi:hypothetical protein
LVKGFGLDIVVDVKKKEECLVWKYEKVAWQSEKILFCSDFFKI